jgi:hypothetical protein
MCSSGEVNEAIEASSVECKLIARLFGAVDQLNYPVSWRAQLFFFISELKLHTND